MHGRLAGAGIAALCALLAACGAGGSSGGTSPLPVVASPPGNKGGSPPPISGSTPTPAPTQTPMFNPASVHVTEVPIPVESPADDGPVYPSVIDVGTDG